MQVEPTIDFLKLLRVLRDDDLRGRLLNCIEMVEKATSTRDIPNLKKLKGYRSAYRIRMGDYRIGLFIRDDTAIFADFAHRKDIYSRFP
jgi:mRNA interferase RelE/StbE